MPEGTQRKILSTSRLNKLDMAKLNQFKTAKAIEEAAKNERRSLPELVMVWVWALYWPNKWGGLWQPQMGHKSAGTNPSISSTKCRLQNNVSITHRMARKWGL